MALYSLITVTLTCLKLVQATGRIDMEFLLCLCRESLCQQPLQVGSCKGKIAKEKEARGLKTLKIELPCMMACVNSTGSRYQATTSFYSRLHCFPQNCKLILQTFQCTTTLSPYPPPPPPPPSPPIPGWTYE